MNTKEIMVDHMEYPMLATFDDLTGTEIRLDGQQILCFYCWEKCFYECNAMIKRPANGSKPSICGPEGDGDFTIKIREANPEVNNGMVEGKLKPKLRKKLDKDLEEYYIDKHLVDPQNQCIRGEDQYEDIVKFAEARIKKTDEWELQMRATLR